MRKEKIPIRKLVINTIRIIRVEDYLQALLNNTQAEILAGTAEEK